MNHRPALRFTSPHILNSPIFPLDTAKNHRLNSIVHRYYWQRLFMQLTAHYLSHSLLASILICERERGEWQRAEKNKERKTDRWRKRELAQWVIWQRREKRLRQIQRGRRSEKKERLHEIKQSEKVLVFAAANLLNGEKICGKTFLFWHHSEGTQ